MKTALVSLPWLTPDSPAIPIAVLSAFLRENNCDVDALHLHALVPSYIEYKDYLPTGAFTSELRLLDQVAIATLFPASRRRVVQHFKKYFILAEDFLVDAHKVLKKLYSGIKWNQYGLVGFQIDYDQFFSSLIFASWLKQDFPKIKCVFGGVLASDYLGQSILSHFPQVDWCVGGEGEIPILSLVKQLESNKALNEDKIPGLIYRHNESVIVNEPRELTSLNKLPIPDYGHFFDVLSKCGRARGHVKLPIEGSRGCVYNCAFCDVHRVHCKYRVKSTSKILKDMRSMSSMYKTTKFFFLDSIFPRKLWKPLCRDLINDPRDYEFFAALRADTSTEQFIMMRRAGFRDLEIGIETLSTHLLRQMRKGTRVIDNVFTLKRCEEYNYSVAWYLILNFPGESQKDIDDILRNVDYTSSFKPPMFYFKFMLYPESYVYRNSKHYNIKPKGIDSSVYSLLPAKIRNELETHSRSYIEQRLPKKDYRPLLRKLHQWRQNYYAARRVGESLLNYWDGHEYLLVRDNRDDILKEYILEGMDRELYLYCDSIRSMDEIRTRFGVDCAHSIMTRLRRMIKNKLMFREDDKYLSLAIKRNRVFQ